jgi:hypothetical protein
MLPLEGEHKPTRVLHSRFNETQSQLSPDGKWLLFLSDESGRTEAYVQAFPNPGPRYQVSTSGVQFEGWSADGKHVLLVGLDGGLYETDVETSPVFKASPPRLLLRVRNDINGFGGTADFQKFIQVVPIGRASLATIGVEVNWAAALGKR